MAAVLLELRHALRGGGRVDIGEEHFLDACLLKMFNALVSGGLLSFAAGGAMAVKMRLKFYNASLMACAVGFIGGKWCFDIYSNSCVEKVMRGLEGRRIQNELAHIIMTKHTDDRVKVQLVKKYLYPEEVFHDLNPDKPSFRLRPRHTFIDTVSFPRNEERLETREEGKDNAGTADPGTKNYQQAAGRTRQSSAEELMMDPLASIFGCPGDDKDADQSDKNGKLSKRQLRALKKIARHDRRQPREVNKNSSVWDEPTTAQ